MNTRILEFSDIASSYAGNYEVGSPMWMNFYNEKFAELIIDHATKCVRDVRDENSDLSYDAASQVQNRIKQFFGVDE